VSPAVFPLVFDTTALVDLYRGRLEVRPYVEQVLAGAEAYVSVLTEAELWRGLKAHEVERHEALLSLFLRLPLHSAAARLAGQWMQRFETTGLGWMDALIVASAKASGLPVLTRDRGLADCLQAEAVFETYGTGVSAGNGPASSE
jgi:predicted nucleic acid-binding protein